VTRNSGFATVTSIAYTFSQGVPEPEHWGILAEGLRHPVEPSVRDTLAGFGILSYRLFYFERDELGAVPDSPATPWAETVP
jgi:4-alpha-glucanotransferase